MLRKKLFILTAVIVVFFFCVEVASAAVSLNQTYKNSLPQKDWTKYGVNPWRWDTDNDGYSDEWEVEHDYCPTNSEAISLTDSNCKKGKINYSAKTYTPPAGAKETFPREIKKFSSCGAIKTVLGAAAPSYFVKGGVMPMTAFDATQSVATGLGSAKSATEESVSADYSQTNVQVAGVDEADMVKTDGKYIYNLANGYLYISQAVPADQIKLLSKSKLNDVYQASELYLEGNYLMVIGRAGSDLYAAKTISYYYGSYTNVQIWNVKNKAKPELVRSLDFSGSSLTSRMTNGYVYLVLTRTEPYYFYSLTGLKESSGYGDLLPTYRDRKGNELKADNKKVKSLVNCSDIVYPYPVRQSDYVEIISLSMKSPMSEIGKKVVLGAGDKVFASQDYLYVVSDNNYYRWNKPSAEQTEIMKFKLDKNKVELVGTQTVPGTVLNQFSLDEYKDNLRIVTTINGSWWGNVGDKKNQLYVLDKDLNRVGWYDNFGAGEKIYSARFIGERAYVVTFLETDPLFVFDLKDARNPKMLGELKIPGYSTYLHPYDATHIIGIGKNAISNTSTLGFAWYQGLKFGLFDVTDPANPTEMFKTEVGDRGTDSFALYDHHAFLFSKEKKLFAIPATVAQYTAEEKKATSTDPWSYGTYNYQGLFVYNLDLVNGFSFLGGISHTVNSNLSAYSANYGNDLIQRSFYIGNYLYALSDSKISSHSLNDLAGAGEVELGDK